MDFGKQNSFNQKPIIWLQELLFKFISVFNMVLGLLELIVDEEEKLELELTDRNCWQSELWFDCIVYNLHLYFYKQNV